MILGREVTVGAHPWIAYIPLRHESGQSLADAPIFQIHVIDDEIVPSIDYQTIQFWEKMSDKSIVMMFAHTLEVYAYLLNIVRMQLLTWHPVSRIPVAGSELRTIEQLVENFAEQLRLKIQLATSVADGIFELNYDMPFDYIQETYRESFQTLNIYETVAFMDDFPLYIVSLFHDELVEAIPEENITMDRAQLMKFIQDTLTSMMYLIANPHIVLDSRRLGGMSQEEIDSRQNPLGLEKATEKINQWLRTWWIQVSKTLSFIN